MIFPSREQYDTLRAEKYELCHILSTFQACFVYTNNTGHRWLLNAVIFKNKLKAKGENFY